MSKTLELNSPAMRLLWDCVLKEIANPHMEASRKERREDSNKARSQAEKAKVIIEMINPLVNAGAQMSEEQAGSLADVIYDHWAPRIHSPTFEERFSVASYINSCRT